MKKYKVTLTAEERQQLHDLVTTDKAAAKKLTPARILLQADAAEGGPAWPDERIAEALDVSTATIVRILTGSTNRGENRIRRLSCGTATAATQNIWITEESEAIPQWNLTPVLPGASSRLVLASSGASTKKAPSLECLLLDFQSHWRSLRIEPLEGPITLLLSTRMSRAGRTNLKDNYGLLKSRLQEDTADS